MDWTKRLTIIRKKAYNDMIAEGIRTFQSEHYQYTVEQALGFTRDELIEALKIHELYG